MATPEGGWREFIAGLADMREQITRLGADMADAESRRRAAQAEVATIEKAMASFRDDKSVEVRERRESHGGPWYVPLILGLFNVED